MQPDTQGFGTQVLRHQCIGSLGKLPGLLLGNNGQLIQLEVRKGVIRPVVGLAGIRMDAIGNELLSQAKHFNGWVLEATKWLVSPVDQQALGRMSDSDRRCITQHPPGEPFDLLCDFLGLQDININADHPACGNPNACLGPVTPNVDFVFGGVALAVATPFWIVMPGTQSVHPGLFAGRLDRQNGIATVDQCGAQTRHVIDRVHSNFQNGGSSA